MGQKAKLENGLMQLQQSSEDGLHLRYMAKQQDECVRKQNIRMLLRGDIDMECQGLVLNCSRVYHTERSSDMADTAASVDESGAFRVPVRALLRLAIHAYPA